MDIQSEELSRRLALSDDRAALLRGPEGRTLVRPVARLGQPYDLLTLNFPSGALGVAAPGSGTAADDSAPIVIDPMIALSPYELLWADPLNFDVDDAALGGSFSAFLVLMLDDDTEFGLTAMQLVCASGGACSASGPLANAVESIGRARRIKSVHARLQASGAGSAAASLPLGPVEVRLLRAKLGRTYAH
jgi:hypothetical protein